MEAGESLEGLTPSGAFNSLFLLEEENILRDGKVNLEDPEFVISDTQCVMMIMLTLIISMKVGIYKCFPPRFQQPGTGPNILYPSIYESNMEEVELS